MSPTSVTLVLASCLMHAGWNLLARAGRSEHQFVRRMLLVTAAAGLLPAAACELSAHSLGATAWACVAGSGFCCGAYYFCLVRAYGSSDFTIVYPVARSLPVLLVAIGDVVRGRSVTPGGWLGMVLVVAGCFLTPLESFRGVRLRCYVNKATIWILLTSLGTVGYTLLDKVASETVEQGPYTAARYGYVFFLIAYISYAGLAAVSGSREADSREIGWTFPCLAAILNFGAYWLVLWAYQFSQHAGYVVAFRQFSVVIGVVSAFLVYKEPGILVRVAGTLLITFGLLLVGIWGG